MGTEDLRRGNFVSKLWCGPECATCHLCQNSYGLFAFELLLELKVVELKYFVNWFAGGAACLAGVFFLASAFFLIGRLLGHSILLVAAEGKCEGEVSKAGRRLDGRFAISAKKFSEEHVISELVNLFKNEQLIVEGKYVSELEIIIARCVR